MLWVWILPLAALSCVIIGAPHAMAPPMEWSVYPPVEHLTLAQCARLDLPDRLRQLFGWGTGIQPFNQVAITLPFYSASAYSLGALLARRTAPMLPFFESMRNLRMKRLLLFVAMPWFCIKVALIWRPATAQYPEIHTWRGLLFILEPFLVISVLITLVFAVAVSLVGRRFFLARFFLSAGEPSGTTHDGRPSEPTG
jgi:hypothetical protein